MYLVEAWMIDLSNETLYPIWKPSSFGCTFHSSTVYRWATKGIKSRVTKKRVKLEIAYIGRSPHTSKEAWIRFLSDLNGHKK